ncbi:MAG: hypothetical protein H0V74_05535 [Chloroflexi bacterium]|nr:hypothetical protein [Chloroflexota bacterium]
MTESAAQPFRLSYHVVIAAAVAVIVPFTGLAWPLALLVGLVISSDERDRKRGVRTPRATRIVRVLAVTGGVLSMMFAGAVLGGLIAFTIAWLTTVSERMAADATRRGPSSGGTLAR